MIVVIEGPSAAGKTTWIRSHAQGAVIEEASVSGAPDRDVDPVGAAAFWAKVSANRWTETIKAEQQSGLVVCDCDPFKLHYVWSLWRIGKVGKEQWRAELDATRKLFEARLLGLADLILIRIPNPATLAEQARSDTSRQRNNFPLHSQLAEPLREWYQAVEQLGPKRVRWELPAEGVPNWDGIGRRSERSGIAIFDDLISQLPAS